MYRLTNGKQLLPFADSHCRITRNAIRFRPLSNDNPDASVFTPTFFGIIGRNRFHRRVSDGRNPVGLEATIDQCLASLLRSRPGELAVILKGYLRTIPDRRIVGMTYDFYRLVTKLLQHSSDPLEQRAASLSHDGLTWRKQFTGCQFEAQFVPNLPLQYVSADELRLEFAGKIIF